MDLYMTNEHGDHPGVWVVADRNTGTVVRTFTDSDLSQIEARTLLASAYDWGALTAAGDTLVAWESDPAVAYIGEPTDDRRVLDDGALEFRDFPQSLMIQFTTDFGHSGSMICGRVDSAAIAGSDVVAAGVFDSGAAGIEAERLVRDQMMTGVSLDPGGTEVEIEVIETDEDGWPTEWIDHFTYYVMAGLTICAVPAFARAKIKVSEAAAAESGEPTTVADPETIAASGVLVDPPVSWFENPEFDGPTPIRVTDDGRIFGHVATWGTCHIGKAGACVTPPPSGNNYEDFATGYVQCDDGCEIPTGVLTLGGGHADIRLNAALAKKHYDDAGTGAADVAIGEDAHGVWIAGALRATITVEQVRELRAAPPSGDWRESHKTGQLELVALLAVNVQGFPVPRVRTVNGQQMALVAAVAPRPDVVLDPLSDALRRIGNLERMAALSAKTVADGITF